MLLAPSLLSSLVIVRCVHNSIFSLACDLYEDIMRIKTADYASIGHLRTNISISGDEARPAPPLSSV